MEKEVKKLLPLEFQKLVKKEKQKNTKKAKSVVEVTFYQTTKFAPESFYKPISKISSFDF